ncbi:hypothetical protein ES332_D05G336900v1 [Gossypium tomentosum]|uniref:Uncharacterized protein n=1 Tax=Gossypium tomentosum TaxID=34277 RepID=A0A5D2L2K3_GOSTO|nr:hypothetical protein ES332_D05G336900v1 [Gossypium tomentosum]
MGFPNPDVQTSFNSDIQWKKPPDRELEGDGTLMVELMATMEGIVRGIEQGTMNCSPIEDVIFCGGSYG